MQKFKLDDLRDFVKIQFLDKHSEFWHSVYYNQYLSGTSRTSVSFAFLSHNGFDIHPAFVAGLLLMSKIDCITIFAVNFSIESIVKRGGV